MSIPVTRVSDVVKGGKLYKAKSDKLTSPLAPMFITVVTAMCVSCLENVPSNMSLSSRAKNFSEVPARRTQLVASLEVQVISQL